MKSTIICLCILAFAPIMTAQEFRATITGTVTDPQGSLIPNAKVEAVNLATRVANEARTNESGVYVVPFLASRRLFDHCLLRRFQARRPQLC